MPSSETAAVLADEQSEAPPAEGVGAFFRGKLTFWLPVLPLVVLDLWSKAAVFGMLHAKGGEPPTPAFDATPKQAFAQLQGWEAGLNHSVFDIGLEFKLVCWRNTGTIWGLARDHNAVLVALRVVALGLIVYFASRTARRARVTLFVLGAILAGALGNLYDNLFEPMGGVRDFLLFKYGSGPDRPLQFMNPFPAFNVADACISCGAITLAIILLFQKDEKAS